MTHALSVKGPAPVHRVARLASFSVRVVLVMILVGVAAMTLCAAELYFSPALLDPDWAALAAM